MECALDIVYLILVALLHILQQQTPTLYNTLYVTRGQQEGLQ
jgi:hypothetical protein